MDMALSPLRLMGICIINCLDDWLLLPRSEQELIAHRSLLLSHLEWLGLKINLAKSSLSPSQRMLLMQSASHAKLWPLGTILAVSIRRPRHPNTGWGAL